MCKTRYNKQVGPVLLQRGYTPGRWLQQPGLLLLLHSNYIYVQGNGLKMFSYMISIASWLLCLYSASLCLPQTLARS